MKKLLAALAISTISIGSATLHAQTAEEIRNDGKSTDNVLSHGMGYHARSWSALSQINKSNIRKLVPVCSAMGMKAATP